MLLVCLGGSDSEGWYRRVRVGQAREFSIENRADEPVLVTIKVDVLVITSLEFLDIPFFFIGLLMRAQSSGYRS